MPTLPEIKQQIAALPDRYIFWTWKEVRALPKILTEGEAILALTSGMMNNHTWLIVTTNRRLLFINRGMFWGTRLLQMSLDRILTLDHECGIAFGSITVSDGTARFGIGMILSTSVAPFVKATQEAMIAYKLAMRPGGVGVPGAKPNPPLAAPAQPPSLSGELTKLAELRDRGVLTEEEFQAQKKKLLG